MSIVKVFHQLTEEKKAEINIEAYDYPVFIIDTSYRIVDVNEKATNDYGLPAHILIGRGLTGLLAKPEEVLNKLMAYDDRISETVRLSTHHGDLFNARLRLKTIDDQGRVFFIVHVLNKKPVNKHEIFVNDVFVHSLDAIALINQDDKVIMVSKKFVDMFGYKESEMIGKVLFKDLRASEYEDLTDIYVKARRGEVVSFNTTRRNKKGEAMLVNVTIVASLVNDRPIGAQVVYRDIEKQLKEAENLLTYQKIIDNYFDGVVIADKHKRISYINHSYQKITGFGTQDLIGSHFDFVDSTLEDSSSRMSYIWQHLAEKNMWQGEMWSRHKNGTLLPLWLQVFVLRDENNQVMKYIAIYKDLGDIDSMNQKLLMIMGKDPLTSTYNRTYFIEKFQNSVLEYPREAHYLIFMDIDDFKEINDVYGHHVGDTILLEFSKRLLFAFNHEVVSRYGGDEFVVFVRANEKQLVDKKIEAFKESIQEPFQTKVGIFNLRVSTGMSVYPDAANNLQDLIHQADLDMYQNKRDKKKS